MAWRGGGGTAVGTGRPWWGTPCFLPHTRMHTHSPVSTPQEPGQKIIDVETAAQMLGLVLPGGRFVPEFAAFLTGGQKDYKKLNADQWAK